MRTRVDDNLNRTIVAYNHPHLHIWMLLEREICSFFVRHQLIAETDASVQVARIIPTSHHTIQQNLRILLTATVSSHCIMK